MQVWLAPELLRFTTQWALWITVTSCHNGPSDKVTQVNTMAPVDDCDK
jgi:hypothetical protein